MTRPEPAVGIVDSGDVELFYRRFGTPTAAAAPLLILHGANYYDSRDWVTVAAGLATDREVVAFDARGYGHSSWSSTQDYSLDAHLADVSTLIAHAGWERTVLVGHSRGGLFALRFAVERPDLVSGLILVDFSPDARPGPGRTLSQPTGPLGPIYQRLADAHAATSRDPAELTRAEGRARVARIFARREGGWVAISRDPAFQSDRPVDRPDWASGLGPIDLWQALEAIGELVPTLVVRGTRSRVYDDDALTRLARLPKVRRVDVDAGHDVAGEAPEALIAAIKAFVADRLEPRRDP